MMKIKNLKINNKVYAKHPKFSKINSNFKINSHKKVLTKFFVKSFLIIFIFSFLLVSVNALIASIGNAIMIVHTTVNPGKTTTIEKSILIRNVNSIAVNVTLVPKDDLEKIIVMNDKNIVLQPNESVEAKFTIKVSQPGVYEGQIIVLFSGVENNRTSNVALASSITIDAAPANLTGTNNQSYSNNNNQNNNIANNTANQANNQNNNQNSQNQNSQNNAVKPQSSILIGLIIVVALAIIGLIIFLIILKRQ